MASPSGSIASSQHRLHSKRHWQKYVLHNVTDTAQVYTKGICEVLVLDVLFQDYICIHLSHISQLVSCLRTPSVFIYDHPASTSI